MTKEEFNKLDIHKKVEYINANIQKFGSASNVCKELNINIILNVQKTIYL